MRSPAESESLPPTPIAFFAAAFLALLRMLMISGCSAAILRGRDRTVKRNQKSSELKQLWEEVVGADRCRDSSTRR